MGSPWGRIGVWERTDRFTQDEDLAQAAAELDELGLRTAWIGGAPPPELFTTAERLLAGAQRLQVASGILNIRLFPVGDTVAELARLEKDYPGRFTIGLGVSHVELADRFGVEYTAPLPAMEAYLDALDGAEGLPPRRVLAALGPRMLELARDRTSGAHPYLTTPEHTHRARETLGDGPLLAPEQKVVLETDPAKARAIARQAAGFYFGLDNYARHLKRLGFSDADLADGGSDRAIDALVAWGDEEAIRGRVQEHLEAGADHVCIQVLPTDPDQRGLPREQWRRLAPALR
jgi:probable F420-dependent oxidoreductase